MTRFSHICDGMNLTGCTEWHNQVGFANFLKDFQIELGIGLGFLFFIISMIYALKKKDGGVR